MTDLAVADRQRLVRVLRDLPELATERSRRDLLVLAGLGEQAVRVDVSGTPAEALTRLVHHLTDYGHVPAGPHALGLLLNTVKGFVDEERQEVLADVLTRYDLMTPVAATPPVPAWRGTTTDLTGTLLRANALHPVALLSTAVAVARCVAHVGVSTPSRSWSGTGFLVGPDLLITANHVLPRADLALRTTFRFNFQDDARGRPERPDDYQCAPGGLFHTNRVLDYTLVQLAGRPGDRWAHLPLTAETVAVGDRVTLVQHPGGRPKHIALCDGVVDHVGAGAVQYVTSTLPGSSGAPVLTDEWRVCALHHAAGPVTDPATDRPCYRNEATMTSTILRDLPTSVRAALPAEAPPRAGT